jgi:hypothetical protein
MAMAPMPESTPCVRQRGPQHTKHDVAAPFGHGEIGVMNDAALICQ